MRVVLGVLLLGISFMSAMAESVTYRVDHDASDLGFVYRLGDDPVKGRFPAFDADLEIDFESVSRSSISVRIDATKASAGLIFATDAMLGPDVLDVVRFPEIRFVSTGVRLGPHPVVLVTGDLTIRGVTRSIEFTARLLVDDPTQLVAKDRLFVALEGGFSRAAFGANGYGDLVADGMRLEAQIGVVRAE